MKKFIFAGGYVQKAHDGGKAFCEELVKGKVAPVKILICMFARLKETWKESFQKDIEYFHKQLPSVQMEFELADYETFIEQVQRADVIYLRGGSSEELVKALQEKSGWVEFLEGKTIAGTSAGANALSAYYFGLHSLEVMQGLKLAPVKTIVHYKSDYHGWELDWDKALKQLEDFKEELPVFTLAEGEFRVLEV